MPYIFLAALGFVLFILLLQRLERAETKLLVATLKWTFVGVLVVAAIYLTLVGRLFHVVALVVLLILLLKRDIHHKWTAFKKGQLALQKPMNRKEAACLLKVDENASPQEIKAAYKRIKPKDSTHRDRITQARDKLLEG